MIRPKLNQFLMDIKEQLLIERSKISRINEKIVSVDTPRYFDFEEFTLSSLRNEIEEQSSKDSKIRSWMGSLLLRLEQGRLDPRYNFLFKVENFDQALASFLRWIFGVIPSENTKEDGNNPPWQEFYKKQFPDLKEDDKIQHNVTILDFSQLASDVLENVTALIGRLILEFMQRCPDRGKYPIVLVLEEAHHYIPAKPINERQTRAREVFERIAKEGRKYGLSLVVASQRPSELSKTVMAQCNSFIVHRIQNPEDKQYFRSVVSDINKDLLDQLPALPQQHALVLGECITVPLQVKINNVDPRPDSHDPQFFKIWSDPKTKPPNFEDICAKWECAGQAEEKKVVPEKPDNGAQNLKPQLDDDPTKLFREEEKGDGNSDKTKSDNNDYEDDLPF
ncbi:ATP-binding protein [archaeon]|nr:ATP-binding protein [archaeon]